MQVEKEIGEKRVMQYHGVGLSAGPEINYNDLSLGCENEEEVGYSSNLSRTRLANIRCMHYKAQIFDSYGHFIAG